jgi:hypothetical protein
MWIRSIHTPTTSPAATFSGKNDDADLDPLALSTHR